MLKINLLSLLLAFPIGFALVPTLGIIGYIIGPVIAALPGTFIGIYVCWKRYGVKADLGASARVLVASTLATLTVYGFLSFFAAANWILFVVGLLLFLIVYLISAPLVGAINQADVNNLRSMFAESRMASIILKIPLITIEKTLKLSKLVHATKKQESFSPH